jgi:hypothetical protein
VINYKTTHNMSVINQAIKATAINLSTDKHQNLSKSQDIYIINSIIVNIMIINSTDNNIASANNK